MYIYGKTKESGMVGSPTIHYIGWPKRRLHPLGLAVGIIPLIGSCRRGFRSGGAGEQQQTLQEKVECLSSGINPYLSGFLFRQGKQKV